MGALNWACHRRFRRFHRRRRRHFCRHEPYPTVTVTVTPSTPALLARAALAAVLAYPCPAALLAHPAYAAVLAYRRPSALLARAALAAVSAVLQEKIGQCSAFLFRSILRFVHHHFHPISAIWNGFLNVDVVNSTGPVTVSGVWSFTSLISFALNVVPGPYHPGAPPASSSLPARRPTPPRSHRKSSRVSPSPSPPPSATRWPTLRTPSSRLRLSFLRPLSVYFVTMGAGASVPDEVTFEQAKSLAGDKWEVRANRNRSLPTHVRDHTTGVRSIVAQLAGHRHEF